MLVVRSEDYFKAPTMITSHVASFLTGDGGSLFEEPQATVRQNSKSRGHSIDPILEKRLRRLFRPYNAALYGLLAKHGYHDFKPWPA